MRPSGLRRFGIAAVTGSLLLASGTVPSFGGPGRDSAEPGATLDLAADPQSTIEPSVLDTLVDAGRAFWRAVTEGNKVFVWLTPADPITAIVPATIIVDDGAPF